MKKRMKEEERQERNTKRLRDLWLGERPVGEFGVEGQDCFEFDREVLKKEGHGRNGREVDR
jgi:hypothetical protein